MKCFVYAARGVAAAVETERNMRIHLAAAFYVVVCGHITGLGAWEWAAVLVCIALVIGSECLNTAIEAFCDEIHPERSDGIARTKDAAAGAVLVNAAVSAVIGGLVFFRAERVRGLLSFCAGNWLAASLLALTVPAWIYFIFVWRKKK